MFKDKAEEAARFYVSLIPNSEILSITHYTKEEIEALSDVPEEHRPGPAGKVKVVSFTLNGQRMDACNGGAFFEFNHGVSFFIPCETQKEIDHLWEKLPSNGGHVEQCGWVRDRYGMPWQIVPAQLEKWLTGDPKKAGRVSAVLYKSTKLEIEKLEKAFAG